MHMVWVRGLGRSCLAIIFIAGGWDATRAPGARPAKVAALGLPQPELLVRANGAAMVVAGSALALGRWPRAAAVVLAGSLVPTTLAGHAFWQETDPAKHTGQQTQFLKNLGLFGGLLLVVANNRASDDGARPDSSVC
jgi:uncharacterized membrane protein YphA (DoxX/SURF4 family)